MSMGHKFGNYLATETATVTHGVLARSEEGDRGLGPIMTHGGPTPREADTLTSSSFASPNRLVNIGFWNVRTMFQSSKAAQVAKEFEEYRLDVLGISECRWTGKDRMILNSGQTLIWSGKEKDHEGGVAMMLSGKAAKSLI